MCMCVSGDVLYVGLSSGSVLLIDLQVMYFCVVSNYTCTCAYWPSPSNQSSYRANCCLPKGVGDHRMGQSGINSYSIAGSSGLLRVTKNKGSVQHAMTL